MTCHGGVRQQGNLSFLFEKSALLSAESGKKAIVPGKPGKSEILKRLKHHDRDLRMPLDADALSNNEINLIEQWIKEGAKWQDHWAFVPPQKIIQPPTNCIDNCKNEIDFFVQAKLKELGINPSAKAEKSVLARRAFLDVIGLPPAPEETKSFFTDTNSDAYERLIDTLLESQHFGEKWASMWLDLARYADSKGYQKDLLRPEMWRYRDWVIKAFNDDMPYDQFTIEQLAGDLMPEPNSNQLLATAFHRNTMTNDEGGTDDEEYRVAAVIDRVNTTMETWQGVTFGCVQCHSHPYDPILHEEYYELMAFFNNTKDRDLYSDQPLAELLSPAQIIEKQKLEKALNEQKLIGDTMNSDYIDKLKHYVSIIPGNVPVMSERTGDSIRQTHVFEKGNWLVFGKKVTPRAPISLSSETWKYRKNRMGLANWLISPDNSLTARVMVNRVWEQLFGRGIVSTLEDFGTQGALPSHPLLLDYLANRFVQVHKWSIKSLVKEIMLSSTYQQSSNLNEQLLLKDPNNIYLARGPRYRLSAEQIRDQALAIGGLLNKTIYGESVMPHQPEGVWNVIRHAVKWKKDKNGQQHRRGLYTFWRRVSPYPSMLSFDVPSRELCVSRRIKTNTPIQALITLNDPVFVEAAEGLANRMISEGGETLKEKISYGFQLALMRMPDIDRINLLSKFYTDVQSKFKSDRRDYSDDEIYRLTMSEVASVILNLDEVIMKT